MRRIRPHQFEQALGFYVVKESDSYSELIVDISGLVHKWFPRLWQVKLIVIDSVTFNFRQDFDDMAGRTRLLADMAQKLMAIAEKHDVAVSCQA